MKILLTGSSGFLGKEFIRYSKFKDIKKICRNHCENGNFRCDLSNPIEVEHMFKTVEYDVILHLASNPNPNCDTKNLKRYINDILMPCINITQFMDKNKKIVFCSSISIYEDSLYGKLKKICEDWFWDSNILTNIIRPCAILGNGLTHGAVYDIIKKLKSDSKTLNLISNSSKPYVYSTDVIKGIDNLIESSNPFINMFPIDNISVKETAEIIMNKIGIKKEIIFEKESNYSLSINSNNYKHNEFKTSRSALEKFCEELCH